ncbi:hypothetical protein OEZ85_007464 [Tetradesmus obliquus]|uniref:DAGKc domain-containing protein n=1 Tax=Tetradesmus obliquus TaxID=3088 RepID=A0ABY8TG18_TETOB|nr:hypothetical protein OEZ85_007464 [Tetradesmus obliquus]
MDAAVARDQAQKTEVNTSKKQQQTVPATSVGQDQQDKQQQVAPRKLLLILHGKRIEDDQVRDAIKQLKEEGHEVVVRVTWDSGDVDQFVREAVELWDSQRYDTLVAGGGDGTLNELVAALLKHDAPRHISIAQLPLGTANDLASASGISLAPLEALRLALDPSTIHPIDVALVNGEVFMNLATAGPVSEVSSKGMSDALKKLLGPAAVAVAAVFMNLATAGPVSKVSSKGMSDAMKKLLGPAAVAVAGPVSEVSSKGMSHALKKLLGPAAVAVQVSSKGISDALKKLLGPAAVAVAGFRQLFITGLKPIRGVRLTLPTSPDCRHDSYSPDQQQVSRMSGDLLVLAAGQARQMGRMLNVCPDALLDDGLLDFTLLFGSPGRQAASLASDVLSLGLSKAQGGMQLLRLPWLVVEADQDLKCNRDGEPSLPANKLVFEVLPRRIQLHLPDSRLLLEGQAAAAEDAAAGPAKQRQRWWRKLRKQAMRTGHKPRPRLLLDLWGAQQPPGRLSRLLPGLRRALGRTLLWGALLTVGFAAGLQAQQLLPRAAAVHEEL